MHRAASLLDSEAKRHDWRRWSGEEVEASVGCDGIFDVSI
jgi:hypothetical protein